MKKIIFCTFLIVISCKENKNISLEEKEIESSTLIEPKERIYIELISYYPALKIDQSNFYVVKNIHNNDTLFVVDKNNLPVYDFIKNYEGVNNSTITLEKGDSYTKKNEYIVNIPKKYNMNNKKVYIGELINLID
ncbi:hypothetical protein [Chryseobacterium tongliaoense]|uniref:hypothetical protein n=1 Tax=Chryseobacterium tongliaoense TaxID=3240933 RepID=UPI0035117ACA